MSKSKKTIITILFIITIIVIILTFIGINYNKKENDNNETEEIIPKITEEYTTATLQNVKTYPSSLNIDYQNKDEVYYYDDDIKYLAYKNGIFYDKEKPIEEDYSEKIVFKLYTYNYDPENDEHCLTENKTNTKKCYNWIYRISNMQDSIDYLVLRETNETGEDRLLTLLNPNTGTKIDLKQLGIEYIENSDELGEIKTYDYDYLGVCSYFSKCGLISYDGKIIIDFIYDSIDYTNKNIIVISKNSKYGIINYKNEVKIPIEYDELYSSGKYIFGVKDNKLNVYNNKYTLITDNISVTKDKDTEQYNYFTIPEDNKVYLENENELYLIDGKLQRKITTTDTFNYIYDEKDNIKYIYTTNKDNNKLEINFYDTDLYEYYKLEKNTKENIDYYINISNIDKTNYYNISIYYDLKEYNENYYIDMLNSKEITEYKALNKYFNNGYSFVLTDTKLDIYKEKELINSINGNYTYLKDYYFINNSLNSIEVLEFKKESHELSQ